ncbi:expressed unknown protein [Seminavis robusta]|uniref:Nucleoside-diphosphate kinase n=1 Tax=Seminavis robusta TaxID=568900 RepID=A0A9N8HF98_9STRA|nr:expressed unknown protein [Seminavis robusta]|eukprot:Sro425_g140180.1 n/a (413) ;mRNA; f:40744-42141
MMKLNLPPPSFLSTVLWLLLACQIVNVQALPFVKSKEAPVDEESCDSGLLSLAVDSLLPLFMAIAVAVTGIGSALVYYVVDITQEKLQSQINNLQVQLGGQTNRAFVFIKPHACKGKPGKVEAVVETALKKAGIRIQDQGEILAETIDKDMLIDTHYGAIASKAVKLKPHELNVPDKGQAEFEKMFGESWQSAIDNNKVYNAQDACEKLGNIDGIELEKRWRKLEMGVDFIKFGGGFYCGKVGDIYVMNAFYMAMRAAYCNPGERIQWYSVSWPSTAMSWADFRGQVLGATDPTLAPEGSIRQTILKQYNPLGLESKPNTGNNGVHASASPLEGLAERMNWMGVSIQDDEFGRALVAAGVSQETIMEWAADAQVTVKGETEPNKTMSVFDTLEDLDADTVLAKVGKIGKMDS